MQEISQTVLMAGFSRSLGSRGYGLHGDSSIAALCDGHPSNVEVILYVHLAVSSGHRAVTPNGALNICYHIEIKQMHIYKSQRPFRLRFSAINNRWMHSGFISWCRATIVFNSITHYNPEERSANEGMEELSHSNEDPQMMLHIYI